MLKVQGVEVNIETLKTVIYGLLHETFKLKF